MQNFRIHLFTRVFILALAATACADDPASLGRPDATPQFATVDASDVSTGDDFTCVVRAGDVQCQGRNFEAQAPSSKTATVGYFVQVSAGDQHACALRDDGTVECWGNNNLSQAPSARDATVGVYTAVTSGGSYNCALRGDGVIECWGNNALGQAPATVTAAAGVFTQVSAKREHTCARRSDGVIQCWGRNTSGQAPATKAAATGTFLQVSTGYDHTCALRTDGKVECWGNNFDGRAPALRTAAVGGYTRVASSDMHSCGLRADGKIECWGTNNYGEAPALIRPPTGRAFTAFSLSNYHSCGIWDDGVLQCLGRYDYGAATSDIPAVLSMVRASAVDGPILLNYTDASDEAEFQIERRRRYADKTYGEWLRLPHRNANFTSTYDWLVTEGYYYQYRVRACDALGTCTPWRGTGVVRAGALSAPAAPGSVSTSLVNTSQISVTWSHTGNESSFTVQRRLRTYAGFGIWKVVATQAADVMTYTDMDVTTGRGYTYRVQACNSIGCSAWTTGDQIINETLPAAPSGLTATALSSTLVRVSWADNSTNEAAFQLQAKSSMGGESSDYFNVTHTAPDATSYDDSSVISGFTYRYRVRSCNVAGCSAYVTSSPVTPP